MERVAEEAREQCETLATELEEAREYGEETRKEVMENEMGIADAHRRVDDIIKGVRDGEMEGEDDEFSEDEKQHYADEKNESAYAVHRKKQSTQKLQRYQSTKFNIQEDETGGLKSTSKQVRRNQQELEQLRANLTELD